MALKLTLLAATAVLACAAQGAAARNIVLTNDDGLTSNVVALYEALKAAGHDVVVSVPCTNQSGQGAALGIARPIAPLKTACLNDAA
jgi:5'-nucleotidase